MQRIRDMWDRWSGLRKAIVSSVTFLAAVCAVLAFVFRTDDGDSNRGQGYGPASAAGTSTGISPGPETSLTAAPNSRTQSDSAEFAIETDPPDAARECRLDHEAWEPCDETVEYSELPVGTHTFEARAVEDDEADPTPADHEWTILAPPMPPTESVPIKELIEAGKYTSDDGGFLDGSFRMKGSTRHFPSSVAMTNYADDTGAHEMEFLPDAPVVRVNGSAGIDADADCPDNEAVMRITDGVGHVYWKETIDRSRPRAIDVELPEVAEVKLVQSSTADNDSCGSGQIDVVWGNIRFEVIARP